MQKQDKEKPARWSFEPSAATIAAYNDFLKSMGKYGESVNKSRLLDLLILDGLRRETKGNSTGERT